MHGRRDLLSRASLIDHGGDDRGEAPARHQVTPGFSKSATQAEFLSSAGSVSLTHVKGSGLGSGGGKSFMSSMRLLVLTGAAKNPLLTKLPKATSVSFVSCRERRFSRGDRESGRLSCPQPQRVGRCLTSLPGNTKKKKIRTWR
jgi:hypothetical protein